jgi:hypothetical protein
VGQLDPGFQGIAALGDPVGTKTISDTPPVAPAATSTSLPLSQEAQAVLDGLNQKAADPAWQSGFDMIERPETRPQHQVISGEVTAFLSDSKQRLAKLGVRVSWNATSKRYEAAPEKPAQAASQLTPLSFRDPDSGIVVLVENDRHHVVAVDKDGKILWCRQPATDGNLPPYSADRPQPNPAIGWMGALTEQQSTGLQKTGSGKFVGIYFNSRQGGALDLKTGDFTMLGQN